MHLYPSRGKTILSLTSRSMACLVMRFFDFFLGGRLRFIYSVLQIRIPLRSDRITKVQPSLFWAFLLQLETDDHTRVRPTMGQLTKKLSPTCKWRHGYPLGLPPLTFGIGTPFSIGSTPVHQLCNRSSPTPIMFSSQSPTVQNTHTA